MEWLKETEEYTIYGGATCVPPDNLNRKFTYFYKPYNFNINSKIYMTYQEIEDDNMDSSPNLEDYVRLKQKQNDRAILS